ncbi:MAG: NAD(+)/NADH kinase [Acidobacteriota bacterium]|nr:NAD(+)/NADH kinase [Acidobacteriota bacterium]
MPSPIRRAGLVSRRQLTAARPTLIELASWLEARDVTPVFESDTAALAGMDGHESASADELPARVDLIIALGGDGTLLGAANRIAAAGKDIPIVGINFGSLGFLTEVTLVELYDAMSAVLDGTATVEGRMMLQCAVKAGPDETPHVDRAVLNDIVITRGSLSRMIDLEVTIDAGFVTRVKADGLILASPTGSTAYNLSAGGPIVEPSVDAFVMTPIAPHTLTNRPVVLSGSTELVIRPLFENVKTEVFVTFDGQAGQALEPGDVVVIRRAARRLNLVRASGRSYYDVLQQKLKWGLK